MPKPLQTLPLLLLLNVSAIACQLKPAPTYQYQPADPQPTAKPPPSASDTIKLTTYNVTGTTASEIRADINRKRSAAIGQSFDAYARWWVQWNYQYLNQGSRCQIDPTRFNVVLTGEIVMPDWDAPPNADPQLVQRWQTYITLLRAHEDQHIQHGREAAQRIQHELPSLVAPTCEQLERLADAQGEAIIAEQAQKDKEYDATTDHGRLEGVQFP